MTVSRREHAVGAESVVANGAGDWKAVYRDLSNIEDVRITLCEPNSELRMSLKMAFQGIGIRDLNDGGSLHGVENVLELGEVDLLIWDTSCAGGDVCKFTHDIRHHRLGKTPFLPIITMVTDAARANIREVMESGPDDLLVKLIEIYVVTPPVGINLFAVLGAVGKEADFRHVALGVIPFIFFDLIVLALLIMFPELATWLPKQMIQG